MSSQTRFPVHESLDVLDGETIYRTDEWHKAVVLYRYSITESDSPELAIYLWHKEDGKWKRKQKYVARTSDAWEEDRGVIERFLPALNDESVPNEVDSPDDTLPVSEYYHVAAAETVFKTDEWWKAVVVIDAKGDYETSEVILYLWQQTDNGWKCRQKYPIKRISDWEDDLSGITKFIEEVDSDSPENESDLPISEDSSSQNDDRKTLKKALENRHLSRQLTGESS